MVLYPGIPQEDKWNLGGALLSRSLSLPGLLKFSPGGGGGGGGRGTSPLPAGCESKVLVNDLEQQQQQQQQVQPALGFIPAAPASAMVRATAKAATAQAATGGQLPAANVRAAAGVGSPAVPH